MSYVLIIVVAMSSYDGGVSVHHVPFGTLEACSRAAEAWNGASAGHSKRARVTAQCHFTGAPRS